MTETRTRRPRATGIPKKSTLRERTAARLAEVGTLAARVATNQAKAAVLKRAIDNDRGALADLLVSLKRKNVETQVPEGVVTTVLIQNTADVIDEAALRKRIGAAAWKKVTRPVLDAGLLEAAIANGEVDANAVAQCTETRTSKPFVKVAAKVAAPKDEK
jgi:hypothetical protein